MLELSSDSNIVITRSAAQINELLHKPQLEFATTVPLPAATQFEYELQLLLQVLRHSISSVASCSAQTYAALTRIDK